MTNKIAVLLSGCGVFDGAEIHESVLTLLALSQQGADYQCVAPNIKQHHVINHLTLQESNEQRNVLVEAARIARGNILDISQINADDFAALIIPGGFGAAKNLSDFAFKGENFQIKASVLSFIKQFSTQQKPVGMCCIAPHLATLVYGMGVKLTVGYDQNTIQTLEKLGAKHVTCAIDQIVVDEVNNLVTTPAYMIEDATLAALAQGISKMVQEVIKLIKV